MTTGVYANGDTEMFLKSIDVMTVFMTSTIPKLMPLPNGVVACKRGDAADDEVVKLLQDQTDGGDDLFASDVFGKPVNWANVNEKGQ